MYKKLIGILYKANRKLQNPTGNPVGIYKYLWESYMNLQVCMNLTESYGNPICIYKNLLAILKSSTKI